MDSILIQEIPKVYSIDKHPSFSESCEFSDKIILPHSLLLCLCRSKTFYPMFYLSSVRYKAKSVVCGVREFTAEENTVYCPRWVLLKLGFRSSKPSSILIRQVQYSKWPILTSIELESDQPADVEICKRSLMQYSFVQKSNYIFLHTGKDVSYFFIKNITPHKRAVVINPDFQVVLSRISCERPLTVHREIYKTSYANQSPTGASVHRINHLRSSSPRIIQKEALLSTSNRLQKTVLKDPNYTFLGFKNSLAPSNRTPQSPPKFRRSSLFAMRFQKKSPPLHFKPLRLSL